MKGGSEKGKMKRYLNKSEKQTVLTIASLQSYLDDKIIEWEKHDTSSELLKCARMARTYSRKLLEQLVAPLDTNEAAKLLREIDRMQCVVKYTDEAVREYNEMLRLDSVIPVETEDLLDIAEQAVNICVACDKTGEAADGCRLRGIMLKYDVEPLDREAPRGRCPYRYKE